MHLPFTPNHVKLITDCYPPQAALLSSGPDCRPNAQELSRLVYYAANKPGKINKLSAELERRLRLECRKAQAGSPRWRASLLITLAIFKALVTECRRDISLLSPSLISSINVALSALPSDLEVSAKAASVFTAWTAYTDGHLIGVDRNVTQEYLAVLRAFARMCESHSDDHEVQNRTRLVGLAALDGAVSSEALFNASPCFKDQVSIIVSAVLVTFYQAQFSVLEHEASVIKGKPHSPYFPKVRPISERHPSSVHLHKDGEKGPSFADVIDSALRVYLSLVGQSYASQLAFIMQAAFDSLDARNCWKNEDQCCWLAQVTVEWAQYQYRYAIPTRLVERLLECQDAPTNDVHIALTSMVTAVFVSSTPLVNLSTSDIISNLISLILRRTTLDPDDPLLPAVVQSVASLGTHVYYVDQIQDLSAELISRLTAVEAGSLRGKAANQKSRRQAIRSLLAGLLGLMHAADDHQTKHTGEIDEQMRTPKPPHVSETSILSGDHSHKRVHPSRRTKISPEVWLDTLTLVCDSDYAVRADYAQALSSYIRDEIPKKGDRRDVDGVKRVQSLSEGPAAQARIASAILYGDSVTRFLNALHAYIYALATSSLLGVGSPPDATPSPTPSANDASAAINVVPTPSDSRAGLEAANGSAEARNEVSLTRDSPPRSENPSRRSTMLGTRFRQISALNRLFECFPLNSSITNSSSSSATLSDYAHILDVLILVHEQLPVRSLLTSVPMLFALEKAADGEFGRTADPRRLNVIREVLARVWLVIANVWDCKPIAEAAEKVLSSVPYPSSLPVHSSLKPGFFAPTQEPTEFPTDSSAVEGRVIGIDVDQALTALVANRNVVEVTGLDSANLLSRLSRKWTADQALKDCVEMHPSPDALRNTSALKVTPTLMNIDNLSLQSLGKFNRGVGVTDLREALEGRSSMSNPALVNRPASISTLDNDSSFITPEANSHHLQVNMPPRPKSRGNIQQKKKLPGDVRDALDKLGIGDGVKMAGSALKSSFPLQKTQSRPSPQRIVL